MWLAQHALSHVLELVCEPQMQSRPHEWRMLAHLLENLSSNNDNRSRLYPAELVLRTMQHEHMSGPGTDHPVDHPTDHYSDHHSDYHSDHHIVGSDAMHDVHQTTAEASQPTVLPTADGLDPLAEVSDPLAEVSEPLAEVSEPLAEVSEPLAEVSEPLAVVSDPFDAIILGALETSTREAVTDELPRSMNSTDGLPRSMNSTLVASTSTSAAKVLHVLCMYHGYTYYCLLYSHYLLCLLYLLGAAQGAVPRVDG